MRSYILISLFLLTFASVWSQDVIGLDELRIKTIMSEERPGLVREDNVKNENFRYLKYSSKEERETWVIFLDVKGICNGLRITCENSCMEEKKSELNRLYRSDGKDRWIYRSRGNEISVDLRDETWFFSITYRPVQKKGKGGNDRTA